MTQGRCRDIAERPATYPGRVAPATYSDRVAPATYPGRVAPATTTVSPV